VWRALRVCRSCRPRTLALGILIRGHAMGRKARAELVLDCAEPSRLAKFWRGALDYRDHYLDVNLAVLVPKEGIALPLLLQRVPEPKTGKNRMHLDIVVDDIDAEIHRLEAIGAQRIDEGVQRLGETRWVRMSDTEQNEFCISTGVEW
jgi:Glyoxalase-like domain